MSNQIIEQNKSYQKMQQTEELTERLRILEEKKAQRKQDEEETYQNYNINNPFENMVDIDTIFSNLTELEQKVAEIEIGEENR